MAPLRELIVSQGFADMAASQADKAIDLHFKTHGTTVASYQLRSITSAQVKAVAKDKSWGPEDKQAHSDMLRHLQSGYIEGAVNKIKGGSRHSKAIVAAFVSCEGKSKEMSKILTTTQYSYYQSVWIAKPEVNDNPPARSSFNKLLTKVETIEKNALKESLQAKVAEYSEEELVGKLTVKEKVLRESLKTKSNSAKLKEWGVKQLEKIRKDETPDFQHAKAVAGLTMYIAAFDRDVESNDS